MSNTVNTARGADINNALIEQVLAESEPIKQQAEITAPSENLVTLPAGYITASGEVIKTAEVRELTGRDEEYISKSGTIAKAFNTILSRAVVKIGEKKVDDEVLDSLLSGDRDALMLGIYKATFGPVAELASFCDGCQEFKDVEVDVDRDIAVKVLVDGLNDRTFTVIGKHEYLVTLPTGTVQKELSQATDKTLAELTTILFENTILEIDGHPVISKVMVQNMGIKDRRLVADELSKRAPGPLFENVTITCPDCGGEVGVPINLGTLFRF